MIKLLEVQWYTDRLNTELFDVWISNGQSMCYVLCTKQTIQILDQYIRKKDRIHLSDIQMVRMSGVMLQ